jgi:exopolyphosphatase/guanosine-5'-triphosphate,3'-diphosphate pyrophosphatase
MSDVHRIAAIDIGTVTMRMLVADMYSSDAMRRNSAPTPMRTSLSVSAFRAAPVVSTVCAQSDIVHLGEGVAQSHKLSETALARAEAVARRYEGILRDFALDGHPAEKVVVLATAAARDADNSQQLIDMLSKHGFSLSVIAGEREARLSFLGAVESFPGENLLVSDVGGGSTELIFGSATGEVDIKRSASYQVGARRLTDLFLGEEEVSSDALDAAYRYAREMIEPFFVELPAQATRLISVAGTVTTLAALREGIVPYDATRVQGVQLSSADVRACIDRLAPMTLAARVHVRGLQPGRAGVIVGGAVVLKAVIDASRLDACTVSTTAILHGIVQDTWRELED